MENGQGNALCNLKLKAKLTNSWCISGYNTDLPPRCLRKENRQLARAHLPIDQRSDKRVRKFIKSTVQ